jgi:hypothetical protein
MNANDAFIHPIIFRGRDYLIRLIKQCMSKEGGPQYLRTLGVTGTAGGLPSWEKKGTFDAETMLAKPWRHLLPAVPGTRHMRGKPRAIFMDATANVRLVQDILASCKRWLVEKFPGLFAAWANPWLYRNQLIQYGLERHYASVETDYSEMDIRFRRQIALDVVCPIYEVMLPDQALRLYSYVEECFEQPLFMGDVVWTGLHTLFSGLGITNDFETLYTVCLVLGCLLELNAQGIILALGDDLSVLVDPRHCSPRDLINLIISTSSESGLLIHPLGTKSNIREDCTIFCREFFSIHNKRNEFNVIGGYYPSSLVLNNIVQPETHQTSISAEVAAMLQRMDNLQYNTEYVPFVQFARRWLSWDLTAPADQVPLDWWARLYGDTWSPKSSPTFSVLQDGRTHRRETVAPAAVSRVLFGASK